MFHTCSFGALNPKTSIGIISETPPNSKISCKLPVDVVYLWTILMFDID
jgi:hypothetical protein